MCPQTNQVDTCSLMRTQRPGSHHQRHSFFFTCSRAALSGVRTGGARALLSAVCGLVELGCDPCRALILLMSKGREWGLQRLTVCQNPDLRCSRARASTGSRGRCLHFAMEMVSREYCCQAWVSYDVHKELGRIEARVRQVILVESAADFGSHWREAKSLPRLAVFNRNSPVSIQVATTTRCLLNDA